MRTGTFPNLASPLFPMRRSRTSAVFPTFDASSREAYTLTRLITTHSELKDRMPAGNSKIPGRTLFSDARRHRSIQRNQLTCWAGVAPALLSTAYLRLGWKRLRSLESTLLL